MTLMRQLKRLTKCLQPTPTSLNSKSPLSTTCLTSTLMMFLVRSSNQYHNYYSVLLAIDFRTVFSGHPVYFTVADHAMCLYLVDQDDSRVCSFLSLKAVPEDGYHSDYCVVDKDSGMWTLLYPGNLCNTRNNWNTIGIKIHSSTEILAKIILHQTISMMGLGKNQYLDLNIIMINITTL